MKHGHIILPMQLAILVSIGLHSPLGYKTMDRLSLVGHMEAFRVCNFDRSSQESLLKTVVACLTGRVLKDVQS